MLQGCPLSALSVPKVDPLCAVDPWLNAKIGTASAPLPNCHAWASWVPSKVSPPQVALRAVDLDSQRDERTKTHSSLVGKVIPAGGSDTVMAAKLVTHRIVQKSVATAEKRLSAIVARRLSIKAAIRAQEREDR